MPKGVKKANLPQKTCLTCERPFFRRGKRAPDWSAVKYRSDRCRIGRSETVPPK